VLDELVTLEVALPLRGVGTEGAAVGGRVEVVSIPSVPEEVVLPLRPVRALTALEALGRPCAKEPVLLGDYDVRGSSGVLVGHGHN
jgi:hypothetical protein